MLCINMSLTHMHMICDILLGSLVECSLNTPDKYQISIENDIFNIVDIFENIIFSIPVLCSVLDTDADSDNISFADCVVSVVQSICLVLDVDMQILLASY